MLVAVFSEYLFTFLHSVNLFHDARYFGLAFRR